MLKVDRKVSRLGLGTWQIGTPSWGWEVDFTKEDVKKAFERAFELGVNFIDTADTYGNGYSEKILSEIIKRNRDDLFLATKVAGGYLRHDDVLKACEASLKRLGTSVIDLYQVHQPHYYVPLSETMRAMNKLLRQGKIRYVGLSNFPVALIKEAQENLSNGEIVSNQVRYNLLQRDIEKEILPYCKRENIAIIAYSPLAKGLLSGKYSYRNKPDNKVREESSIFQYDNLLRAEPLLNKLKEIGQRYGKTISQVSLSWLFREETIYPIVGIKRTSQVEDSIGALGWQPRRNDWNALALISDSISISYLPNDQ